MLTLITSCKRTDLLHITLNSLIVFGPDMDYVIHEDSENIIVLPDDFILNNTNGIGQHKSIELFLKERPDKYYFHCEDDWDFWGSWDDCYDWIAESVRIMEKDPMIIKVLCRCDSPHPVGEFTDGYCVLKPWTSDDGIVWNGFSWNPGVTRMDLLKEFVPFGAFEQDVAAAIAEKGYKVVMLERGVCKHIGEGRSTHS